MCRDLISRARRDSEALHVDLARERPFGRVRRGIAQGRGALAAPSDFSRARFGGRVGISLQRDRSKSVDIFDQAAWARFSPSARSAGRCRAQRHAVWRRCHGRGAPCSRFLSPANHACRRLHVDAGRPLLRHAGGVFGGHQFQPALHEDVVLRRAPAHDTHRAKPAGARIAGLDRARTEGTDLIRSIAGVRQWRRSPR